MATFFKDLGKSIANKTINPLKNMVKDKAEYNIDLSVASIEVMTNKQIMVEVKVRRGNKDVLTSTQFKVSPAAGGGYQKVHLNQPHAQVDVTIFSKTVDNAVIPQPKDGEIIVSFADVKSSFQQQTGTYKQLNYCRHFGDFSEQTYELDRSEPIDPKVHVKSVTVSAKMTIKDKDATELNQSFVTWRINEDKKDQQTAAMTKKSSAANTTEQARMNSAQAKQGVAQQMQNRERASRQPMTTNVSEIDSIDEARRLEELRAAKQKEYQQRTAEVQKELDAEKKLATSEQERIIQSSRAEIDFYNKTVSDLEALKEKLTACNAKESHDQ